MMQFVWCLAYVVLHVIHACHIIFTHQNFQRIKHDSTCVLDSFSLEQEGICGISFCLSLSCARMLTQLYFTPIISCLDIYASYD